MGLFDLRCGVSRISTLWRPEQVRRVTCSMFLLEHLGGAVVPWTPPIRGTYDRCGAIELWPEDISEYTTWAGERLWSLWESGALVTSWPDDLADTRPERTRIEQLLHHAAETAYNGITLTIDGRRVEACIVLDLVAEAIAAADPTPPRSLADALAAWFPDGGAGRRWFADPPPAALPQLARHASVRAHATARGGFTPIRSKDARQHGDADIRRYLREAHERHDGPIRSMLDALDPRRPPRGKAAIAREAAEGASRRAYDAAVKYTEPRPYSPREWFLPGEVIEHAKFGVGLVEEALPPDKIRVRFGAETRVLVNRPR